MHAKATCVLLVIGWASAGGGSESTSAPSDSTPGFQIECAGTTSRSVHLAWETDHEVRTLRTGTAWNPSTPTGPTHRARIAPGEGRGGSAGATIAGTASAESARGCFIQDMEHVREPGRYDFSLFYRTADQDDGTARLVIDCYVGDERAYHGLVSSDLTPSDDWSEARGSFDLPDDVRLTRVLLYQRGKGTAWYDDVRLSKTDSSTNLVADGGFEGTSSWRVFFRKKGEDAWQPVDAVVLERFHNVIFLEPETPYEFLVRRVSADVDRAPMCRAPVGRPPFIGYARLNSGPAAVERRARRSGEAQPRIRSFSALPPGALRFRPGHRSPAEPSCL